MFLLDTNVVSELRKAERGRADANVVAWANSVALDSLFVSVIVLFEIETGILQLAPRDPVQASVLRQWMDRQVLPAFEGRILPVDLPVALRAAELEASNPRSVGDCLIAATGVVHNLTIVTRNVADFDPLGVPILNPWLAPP